LGGKAPQENTDECTVTELIDGRLLLNMRSNGNGMPNRKKCYSADGGLTWSAVEFDSTLIEPVCQGALLTYNLKQGTILFTNPHHIKQRKNLSLHISFNNAATWQKPIVLHWGKSAYNDVVALPNGNVLCIYETGKLWPYSGIALTTIKKNLLVR
jgi:sialidase-1